MEAAEENLVIAGAMIFVSFWLDMADGFTARKLDAASEFGLQLDSLVDMICFGAAPAVLVFQHLTHPGRQPGMDRAAGDFLCHCRRISVGALQPAATQDHCKQGFGWPGDHPGRRYGRGGCAR